MTKEQIKEIVSSEIDALFDKLHKKFNTVSGDISWQDELRLEQLENELAELITNQIHQNM